MCEAGAPYHRGEHYSIKLQTKALLVDIGVEMYQGRTLYDRGSLVGDRLWRPNLKCGLPVVILFTVDLYCTFPVLGMLYMHK